MCSDDTVRIPLRARDGSVRAYALIDAADADFVNQWQWFLATGYATRGDYSEKRRRTVHLHRSLLGLVYGDGTTVDHINRDRLDNRRRNLRLVPRAANPQNLPSYTGSLSAHRGVSWDKSTGKWHARVKTLGKRHHLGLFVNETDAAEAARAGRARLLPYAID